MEENCRKSFTDTKVRCKHMAYHGSNKYDYGVFIAGFI